MPGRAINNDFLESVTQGNRQPKNCIHHCIKTCDVEHSPYCIILALLNAYKGKLDRGFCFAGANAYKAEEIISVHETFERIKQEYEKHKISQE